MSGKIFLEDHVALIGLPLLPPPPPPPLRGDEGWKGRKDRIKTHHMSIRWQRPVARRMVISLWNRSMERARNHPWRRSRVRMISSERFCWPLPFPPPPHPSLCADLIAHTPVLSVVSGPHEDRLTIVKRRKLQWYGYVSRSSGLAKTILQGTVKGGRRQGRQRKRWEDYIREWAGLEFGKSQRAVENREKWR